jgi:E3 ubiquitin-protein ligase SHPRH
LTIYYVEEAGEGIHCDHIFIFVCQEYESRLFRLNKLHGGITTSAEEAVNLLKRNSERNRYYWNLERQTKNLLSSSDFNEESKKRKTGETVMVSFLTSIGQTKPSFIYQMFNSGDSSWPSVNHY